VGLKINLTQVLGYLNNLVKKILWDPIPINVNGMYVPYGFFPKVEFLWKSRLWSNLYLCVNRESDEYQEGAALLIRVDWPNQMVQEVGNVSIKNLPKHPDQEREELWDQ